MPLLREVRADDGLAEHQVVMLGIALPSIRLVAVRTMRAAPGSMARGCCSAPVAVAFCSAPGSVRLGWYGPLGVFLLGACCQCGVSGGGQDLDGRRPRWSAVSLRPSSAVPLRSSSDTPGSGCG